MLLRMSTTALSSAITLSLVTNCGERLTPNESPTNSSTIVSAVAADLNDQAMWLVQRMDSTIAAGGICEDESDSVALNSDDECTNESSEPPIVDSIEARDMRVPRDIAGRVREVPGLVQAERMVELYAPAPGVIQEVRVSEGDSVRQGDVLVSLEDAASRAAVNVARAQAESRGSVTFAESEVAFAEALVRRMESARAGEARGVSQQEIDSARANLAKSQANLVIAQEGLVQAEARYALEQARVAALKVVAPFDGIVSMIDVSEGEKAFDNLVLVRVVDPSSLSVVLYIPWEYREQLHPGTRLDLVAEGPVSGAISAELLYVDPVLDPALQAVRTRWRIDNAGESLPIGFLVRFDPRALPATETEDASTADSVDDLKAPSVEQ